MTGRTDLCQMPCNGGLLSATHSLTLSHHCVVSFNIFNLSRLTKLIFFLYKDPSARFFPVVLIVLSLKIYIYILLTRSKIQTISQHYAPPHTFSFFSLSLQ